jgi:hypothetical protein
VVKAVIEAANMILLVIPVVVLFILTVNRASGGVKIGVLVAFVIAFAMAVALLTKASRHEMFAASAASVMSLRPWMRSLLLTTLEQILRCSGRILGKCAVKLKSHPIRCQNAIAEDPSTRAARIRTA